MRPSQVRAAPPHKTAECCIRRGAGVRTEGQRTIKWSEGSWGGAWKWSLSHVSWQAIKKRRSCGVGGRRASHWRTDAWLFRDNSERWESRCYTASYILTLLTEENQPQWAHIHAFQYVKSRLFVTLIRIRSYSELVITAWRHEVCQILLGLLKHVKHQQLFFPLFAAVCNTCPGCTAVHWVSSQSHALTWHFLTMQKWKKVLISLEMGRDISLVQKQRSRPPTWPFPIHAMRNLANSEANHLPFPQKMQKCQSSRPRSLPKMHDASTTSRVHHNVRINTWAEYYCLCFRRTCDNRVKHQEFKTFNMSSHGLNFINYYDYFFKYLKKINI